MSDFVICLTTCEPEDSERIAHNLVEQRVCACVNIIPQISSTYRWRGGIETAMESLLIIKTRRDTLKNLERALKEIHPYEVPEFVVMKIADGSADYLSWITESLRHDLSMQD